MEEGADSEPITVPEAEELVRRATRGYLDALERRKRPLQVGVGDIRSHADLVRSRERIQEAFWGILGELHGVERPTVITRRVELQLFEYEMTQHMYKHYNSVNTVLMILLVAIPIAVWGLLISATHGALADMSPEVVVLNLVLLAVSSLILYYMTINRQIMHIKCDRLKNIETDLVFLDQHSCFAYDRRSRLGQLWGPGGQSTEILLYWVVSMLGILLTLQAMVSRGLPWIIFSSLMPLVFAVWWGARCKVSHVSKIPGYEPRRWQKPWLWIGGYRDKDGESKATQETSEAVDFAP